MSAVEIVALVVAGTVAYVACAGLTWRLIAPVEPEIEICGTYEIHRYAQHDKYERAKFIAGMWLAYLVAFFIVSIARAFYLPLRATFRLCAGNYLARKKEGSNNGKAARP